MSASEFTRAVVILGPGTLESYQGIGTRCRVENPPQWMMSREKIVQVSFDTPDFTTYLDNLAHMQGKKPPPVDVILTDNKGKMSHMVGAAISDWWPSLVTIMGVLIPGEPRKGVTPEIHSEETILAMKIEQEMNEKLKQEPDLGRFRIIDWED